MKTFKIDSEQKIGMGFKVPDDYFDTVTEKILRQIEEPEVKVIPLGNRKSSWMFAAAAVLVLALLIPMLNTFSPNPKETDAEAIENYLSFHSSFTDDQLTDLLETEDIEKIKIDSNLEDVAVEDVLSNTINLEQYIID